jgi:GNAT superfamily N-acetyltransferase
VTTSTATETVFAVEKYRVIWEEGERGLFNQHWKDLAIDKVIPWEMNHEMYTFMEDHGMLHCVTARNNGRIVGYHTATLAPHLHYKSAGIMAYEDLYYLLPEFRRGGAGARLFMFVESDLRKRGITKWFVGTKVHSDNSELLKALGFRLQDYCFTKLLVDKEP